MLWWRKKKEPESPNPERLALEELKRHRIALPGRPLIINFIDEWKSSPLETLYDLAECYVLMINHAVQKNPSLAHGYKGLVLRPEQKQIWKKEYFKIFAEGIRALGLKLSKEKNGEWVVIRCFSCDECNRRTECLIEE